jgi:CelD/BcsL family acetyltransferase involved in cellulose biosynthesis
MSEETKTRKETLAAAALRRQTSTESAIDTPVNGTAASRGKKQEFSIVVVENVHELEPFIPAWENLVTATIEPNVFYEPWMLIPAIKAFAEGKELQFVLIFAPDPTRPTGPPLLCGLFPLVVQRHFTGLGKKVPLRTLSLWRHPLCYLCTPLLRRGYAQECFPMFFRWLKMNPNGCALMDFGMISADDAFHKSLIDYLRVSARLSCVTDVYNRALLCIDVNSDEYLRSALAGVRRKELRRQERRLAEHGQLIYRTLTQEDNVELWIEAFLECELKSWKGDAGRALASNELQKEYFVTIAREAFRRDKLMMLALYLDGEAIAFKCNFLALPGSFAFKIAFSEDYARFSPGVLLEIENINRVHTQGDIRWMDSCADPDRFMINHLWRDRRSITNIVVGTGKRPGDLAVAAIPMFRWFNRMVLRRKVSGAIE